MPKVKTNKHSKFIGFSEFVKFVKFAKRNICEMSEEFVDLTFEIVILNLGQ